MNQDILKQKQAVVSEVSDLINKSNAFVVAEYRGLTVKEISELRKELRSKGAQAVVYKNSLVERAVDGKDYKEVETYLEGPNMFIFLEDYSNGSLDM